MKHLLLAFMFTAVAHAAEPNYSSFFSHPAAQINTRIGTARSTAVPYKNHSVPKTPQETPSFQSGFETSGDDKNSWNVMWRFIKKTEYGDLYLFIVEKDEVLVKAVPALYSGASMVAYDRDNIRLTIEPVAEDAR